MSLHRATSERLATFPDAVFAVIITIMVLDLKPPAEPTLRHVCRSGPRLRPLSPSGPLWSRLRWSAASCSSI